MGEFEEYYYTPEDAKEERDREKRRHFENQLRNAYLAGELGYQDVRNAFQSLGRRVTARPPWTYGRRTPYMVDQDINSISNQVPSANLPLPDVDGTDSTMDEELRINMSVDDILREEMNRTEMQEALDRKRAMVQAFGQDTYEEGQVIRFEKNFLGMNGNKSQDKWYNYAAIKAGGTWYTTGPLAPKGYTWADLVLWLIGGSKPTPADEVAIMNEATTIAAHVESQKGMRQLPAVAPYEDKTGYTTNPDDTRIMPPIRSNDDTQLQSRYDDSDTAYGH